MIRNFMLLSLCAVFLFSSCVKESENQELLSSVDLTVPLYYVDNVEVNEADFPTEEARAYLGITKRKDTREDIPVFNAFTSREAYLNWGKENGYKVEMELELEEHLSKYAEENGIISRYEESGVVAPSYLAYEKDFISKMHVKYGLIENENRAPAFLRKTCGMVGDFFIVSAAATLPSSHNNRVSATLHTHPQAYHAIYNRTFFRARIGTFWEFGANWTCFFGWFAQFDNLMSSVMII